MFDNWLKLETNPLKSFLRYLCPLQLAFRSKQTAPQLAGNEGFQVPNRSSPQAFVKILRESQNLFGPA